MARILVIDDEKLDRFTLREILESQGHEVSEAISARDGLDKVDDMSFDLVIADLILSPHYIENDLLMPEKEGVETIIEIKRRNPKISVIAISGGGKITPTTFQDIARKFGCLNLAKKHGADLVLAKPFVAHELLALVDQLLK